VLIIGGGPGGAAAARFLIREGIKPIILEREAFPRFRIGESMTGEAGQVLRRLDLKKKMLSANYPVKHGVKVYGSDGANSWFISWQIRRSHFGR
jgi:1H-pyrrole-2-carbonyl-[peptidyl-carrier protein] brominase